MDLLASLQQLLSEVGLTVREQETLPGRSPVNVPIPANLHPRVVQLLQQRFPDGVWRHQALAIEHAIRGNSVCVATQTASGKSLIFMAYAAHVLLSDPKACIITLYPARSLIQDQRLKWSHLLRPLGLDFDYIDGGIPTERRLDILRRNRLLLMTPDVLHSWLLSNVSETCVRSYLAHLNVVILDEVHVYEGVFGTNFAYLMRRLLALSNLRQILAASATLGEPARFLQDLTGLPVLVFGPAEDGAPVYEKTVLLAGAPFGRRSGGRGDDFRTVVNFVRRLVNVVPTPFLAFADSRRLVEHLASGLHSRSDASADSSDDVDVDSSDRMKRQVLPYRAGYEEEDRVAIQQALMNGTLGGVVSTSALELGIDIGHIDVVALLHPLSTRKAFWQRLGRCGRMRPGVCILLDLDGRARLDDYLRTPSESNRLYLENPYLQYTNALCAANELVSLGAGRQSLLRFVNVPEKFLRFLENELEPIEPLPPELAVLKQRALTSGPHIEFPLRNAIDEVFGVFDRSGRRLGQVTYSQALREAYPGAVYYYLARPYRVVRFDFRNKRIEVRSEEKRYTTRPDLLQLAFPRWPEGVLGMWRCKGGGFVVESEMQVMEKLIGFIEHRGSVREAHQYGPESIYCSRPLLRFFETTGVAWWFSEVKLNDDLARLLWVCFCDLCGVQERDVALGWFYSRRSPVVSGEVSGWCIYDCTYGSLRLTQQLAERFREVVWEALRRSEDDGQPSEGLWALAELTEQLVPDRIPQTGFDSAESGSDDWVVVVARGERALYFKAEATEEVLIRDFRYTPRGVVYDIEPGQHWDRRQVPSEFVKPIHGVTRLVRWNLMTGEEQLIEK